MSIASTDGTLAFRESLDVAGETVRLVSGGNALDRFSALVNRSEYAGLRKGEVDYDQRNLTTIEFLVADVDVTPDVGQSIKDSVDVYHKIQKLRKTDITWFCTCVSEEDPS